jgi:DNA mismatch repair protein MutL
MEGTKYAKIRRLPDELIAQLKAGEIIENPAQVIKELIDNSIDALSTEITLHIEQSGLSKISVEDNGVGMSQEDVLIAFSQHTTSKITHIFDLFQIKSFGFRGEALFSIKNAGNLFCQTAHKGIQTSLNFIQYQEPFIQQESTTKNGTKIVLTDLFKYNPVRLKFLHSIQKERKKIQHILLTFF